MNHSHPINNETLRSVDILGRRSDEKPHRVLGKGLWGGSTGGDHRDGARTRCYCHSGKDDVEGSLTAVETQG